MKNISTYAHGVLDYVVGIVLLIAPNLFGFAHLGGAPVMVARLIGLVVIVQALFTNFELGLFKPIPVRVHLFIDYLASLILAVSPWLFGFNTDSKNVWVPHLLVGIAFFLITWMTQTVPRQEFTRRSV